jgi:DNA-binding NtrC family response regulator
MKGARILICDDELLIRMWLEEHLREEGYDAHGFGDGVSLLQAVEHQTPDMVLLDLRLPDETGIQILPKLKAIDPLLPVIMISAFGEVETAVAAVRAGAHHFLEKPIQLPELILLIEQALKRASCAASLTSTAMATAGSSAKLYW